MQRYAVTSLVTHGDDGEGRGEIANYSSNPL